MNLIRLNIQSSGKLAWKVFAHLTYLVTLVSVGVQRLEKGTEDPAALSRPIRTTDLSGTT